MLRWVSAWISGLCMRASIVRAFYRKFNAVLIFPILRQQQAMLLNVMAMPNSLVSQSSSDFLRRSRAEFTSSFLRQYTASMLHISHSCLHERVNQTDQFGHQSTYLFTVDPEIDLLDAEQLFQDPDGLNIFALQKYKTLKKCCLPQTGIAWRCPLAS